MANVNIGGVNVSYTEAGKGETVIMLHCSASAGGQWQALQRHIGDDFKCVMPDLYGSGKTDPWPGREAMSLSAEAALVTGLAARFSGPVHLVGHSYGGAVALRMATQNTHRIKSLTLIEPVSFHLLRQGTPQDQELFQEIADLADTLCRAVISGDEWNAMGKFVDYWNGKGTWISLPWEKRQQLAPRIRTTVQHFWSTIREPMQSDSYRHIRVPTAVVRGGFTRQTTSRIADILVESLPEANDIVIPEAAHMVPMSHPERLSLEMMPFLNGFAQPLNRAA